MLDVRDIGRFYTFVQGHLSEITDTYVREQCAQTTVCLLFSGVSVSHGVSIQDRSIMTP